MAIDAANPGAPRYTFQPVLTAAQCQANVCPQGSPTDSAEEAIIMVTSLLPGNYNERALFDMNGHPIASLFCTSA